jgi:hypothetical protein
MLRFRRARARRAMAEITDERKRRELQCVVDSWEGIAEHTKAQLEPQTESA